MVLGIGEAPSRFEDTAWSDEAELKPKSSDFAI